MSTGLEPHIFDLAVKALYYGNFKAARDIALTIEKGTITAFIGPSGCGKSTVLRCLNRMNDLKRGFRFEGQIQYLGKDIYAKSIDPVAVRRTIGMVFQKPNPFAMTVYRNVAYGLKLNGYKGNHEEKVEEALRGAALWEEVKDKLHSSALALSGGQQQRLCIARALAVRPRVLLMDEPCSALDPTSTNRIEETIREIASDVTVVIVTHNMQQAQRVSHSCAFFLAEENQPGRIVEGGSTMQMFANPSDPRTADYVHGRFG